MRPVRSAALLYFACSAVTFAQGSIERELTRTVYDANTLDAGPVTTSHFVGSPSGVGIANDLAELPALAGVSLAEVQVDVTLLIVADFRVRGLDPAGTYLLGTTEVNFGACNAICTWGPLDVTSGIGVSFGIPASQPPLAAGEVRDLSPAILATGASATYAPGHPSWAAVVANPDFYVNVGHSGLDWNAANVTGAPTQVAMERQESTTIAEADLTVRVRYDEAPLFATCVAPPNATGVPGQVSAFGSLEAGQDWLIIRGRSLPDSQLAVLFVGTQNAFVPFANYNLCVGGSVTREGLPTVSSGGIVDFDIDLAGRIRGDSVYLQVFHRDPVLGVAATSAFSFFVE